MRECAGRAFTLMEMVILLLVLGALAAITVPQFTRAGGVRDTSVQTTLSYLRNQIDLFRSQHGNVPPQNGCLWTLLQTTSSSGEAATVSPVGTAYGPYFRNNPLNAWNGLSGVSDAPIDTGAGWYYRAGPRTYELRIRNLDGSVNDSY